MKLGKCSAVRVNARGGSSCRSCSGWRDRLDGELEMQTEVNLGGAGELSKQVTREAIWVFLCFSIERFVGMKGGGRVKMWTGRGGGGCREVRAERRRRRW